MRKIKRTICLEETVSRLPSLFAYIGYNELGERVLHRATDSLDGSYGKLVESIKVPWDLTVDGEVIFTEGECISYRTLMHYYYKYKDGVASVDDSTLIVFVDRAIGKYETKTYFQHYYINTERFSDIISNTQYNALPDRVKQQYVRLTKYKRSLIPPHIYISQARKMYDEMSKLKKLCDEFNREIDNPPEDETFETRNVCCTCEKYYLNGGDIMLSLLHRLIEEAEIIADEYYTVAENSGSQNAKFAIQVNLTNTYNDIGYYTPYLRDWKPGQELAPNEKFIYRSEDGEMRMYQNTSQETQYGKYDEINETPVFDDDNFTEVTFSDTGDEIELEEQTDSKLKSLRRFANYTNQYNVSESPVNNEDWLFYYCEGLLVNYNTKNDELGNIGFYDGDVPITQGGYVVNLMAYGDMVTEITAGDSEITFKYVIGAHLKAKLKSTTTDDGNVFYHYDEFVVDEDSEYSKNSGVHYTETYTYPQGGDLDELVTNGIVYDKYPSGQGTMTFDNYKKTTDRFLTQRFEFYTGNNRARTTKQIGHQVIPLEYLRSDLTFTNTFDNNRYDAPIFKEDYLMGIHYKPYVEDNVNIDRGKNAAFERHIKLGEVKTLQDLENYQNGGFFNLKEY